MFKCLGFVHVMVNGEIFHGLNTIGECAHGYGYDLNLEIDNMCPLIRLEFLSWWHYEMSMKIYVHYVKWLLCESKWINDTSGPVMQADKNLVVVLWHLEPCLVVDKDLVITWSCRGIGFYDFNRIMCTWWFIYDEFFEIIMCMMCLMKIDGKTMWKIEL